MGTRTRGESHSLTPDLAYLAGCARDVRKAVVRMAQRGKTPHVASALSSVDLLVALYFHELLVDPKLPEAAGQDSFVLSKGHGCMALYATLAQRGFFPTSWLDTYAQDGSRLAEHPSPRKVPGIEVGTGSLGHGLAIGAGRVLGRRLAGQPGRCFVLMSDGECNEGSVWEAAMFAAGAHLEGLVAMVDYNKWQAMGRSDEVSGLPVLAAKWEAFGFGVREVDGHDMGAVVQALQELPFRAGAPSVLVAHTVKGKGVSFMEDDLEWHYRSPSVQDLERANLEIDASASARHPGEA